MYVNYVRMLPVLIDTLLQIADTVERLAANDGTAKPDLGHAPAAKQQTPRFGGFGAQVGMDFCDLGHDAEELDRRMALTRAGKRNTEPQERDAAGRVCVPRMW